MSPGFAPWPSLSEPGAGRLHVVVAGVAGVRAPAFVERPTAVASGHDIPSVAGVRAPAFVERQVGHVHMLPHDRVSPGFAPRPSLSGPRLGGNLVAVQVSPGFAPRPSLSATCTDGITPIGGVSPGFAPRPSLSAQAQREDLPGGRRVAGVRAPAFVERGPATSTGWCGRAVSPGFAPRPSLSAPTHRRRPPAGHRVSPGFAPRPSLSAPLGEPHPGGRGRVAGVRAPAFVERAPARPAPRRDPPCRRGSRPGLR